MLSRVQTSRRKRKYRVVSRIKFVISSAILSLIALIIMCILSVAVVNAYSINLFTTDSGVRYKSNDIIAYSPNKAKPKGGYQFKHNTVRITSMDINEYIHELEKILEENLEVVNTLEEKYNNVVQETKDLAEGDFELYEEFKYVLDFPSSDFTLDDIKMVTLICEEYGGIVDPHLWFALVELESGYNSNAKNPNSTASGWGQVLKGTGKWLYEDKLELGTYNHSTMGVDKEINARLSIYYLGMLIEQRGNVNNALVSYNGGELGTKYTNIVSNKLKNNSGLTLKQVE